MQVAVRGEAESDAPQAAERAPGRSAVAPPVERGADRARGALVRPKPAAPAERAAEVSARRRRRRGGPGS